MVRIKCAVCPDFDLCLDCFSVGAQITPHQNDHAYRVMDCLSFPLFHPDWGVRHYMPAHAASVHPFGGCSKLCVWRISGLDLHPTLDALHVGRVTSVRWSSMLAVFLQLLLEGANYLAVALSNSLSDRAV